jgi:hypothetical protein
VSHQPIEETAMNFMHQIGPCEERAARLADAGIDYRRYEMLARRKRRQALDEAFSGLRTMVARIRDSVRAGRRGKGLSETAFREA